VLAKHARRLSVKSDTPVEYKLVTKSASPFPQHKGQPLYFGLIRLAKAYVSFHLMPLYVCPVLAKGISPLLKKRLQGKTCFNFKTDPEPEQVAELQQLTQAAVDRWGEQKCL